MVDLTKMNLDAKDIVTISMKGEEVIKISDSVSGHRDRSSLGSRLLADREDLWRANVLETSGRPRAGNHG